MFSLILRGFEGRTDARAEAFLAAFGQLGCYGSLASNYEKYTPCELAANLTEDGARRKAALFGDALMLVEIVPTADVVAGTVTVKHRAWACWPTHRATNGESFTARDGVVVRGVPLDLKERIARWRKVSSDVEPWRFELGYNHDHPTNVLDRYGLRLARERGAEIGAALTECFPAAAERRFLIVYLGEQVSFCQFTEELALGITPGDGRIVDLRVPRAEEDVCFCEVCERTVPIVVRPLPDAEFPHARFADCPVCGNEIILWANQEVVLASDAATRRGYSPRDVPIDPWEYRSTEENVPTSLEDLKAAVSDRLHPRREWIEAATRLWLGRESSELAGAHPLIAWTLLQIEDITALLLAYRVRQMSLPPEEQDRSLLTPERLGIGRSSLLYHPARRALAPVTVVTSMDEETTRHSLLNGTGERYAAGRRLDEKYAVYEGRFGYGLLDTRGRPLWMAAPNGKQYRVVNDMAPHAAKPWTCSPYAVAHSLKRMREIGTERCVAFTILCDEHKRVIAQHRRLFRRFYEMDIEPNPSIDMSLNDGFLTLRSDVFVWGVVLGWHNAGKLPDNTFDLLPGIAYSIPWDEAVCGAPKIMRTGNSLLG